MSKMEADIKGDSGSGNIYNEVHIDNVGNYAPDARSVVNNQGTTVNINLKISINIDGQKILNLFRRISRKFNLVCRRSLYTRFDGGEWSDCFSYQISGFPSDIASALYYIEQEFGDDMVEPVRYVYIGNCFERNNLTIVQAIDIAEYETRL